MSVSLLPVDDDIPLPPGRLRYKVAGDEQAEWFTISGRQSVQDLNRALAAIGRRFGEFEDVLEWGCGCGRILRHLPPPHAPHRIHGNDIDPEAIDWVKQNLPWVETSLTDGMPPLPYPDQSFDLIYNHSVMTHLDATYQDAWLSELRRVIRPGGVITLTVAARNAFQMYLDAMPQGAPERIMQAGRLHADGILYIDQDQWTGDFPDFYHTAFHDVPYVFNHWTKFFDLRCYIPRGALGYQDLIVLQKPLADDERPHGYLDFVNAQSNAPALLLAETARAEQLERMCQGLRQAQALREAELQRLDVALQREMARMDEVAAQLRREAVRTDEAAAQLRREAMRTDEATAQLRQETARADQSAAELRQVYASRSWSLTKPWRTLGGLVKSRNGQPADPAAKRL